MPDQGGAGRHYSFSSLETLVTSRGASAWAARSSLRKTGMSRNFTYRKSCANMIGFGKIGTKRSKQRYSKGESRWEPKKEH